MKRKALSAVVVAGIIAAMMVGAAAIYFFTAPPNAIGQSTASSTLSVAGTGNLPGEGGAANVAGSQVDYQPQGIWADYLGYIPAGYTPAPHGINAPTFSCPAGMSAAACTQFKQTCGNGVCDPNESCSTCPLDCAPPGDQTCDPYTGRAGAPISICFIA